jgi:hypothetical protein
LWQKCIILLDIKYKGVDRLLELEQLKQELQPYRNKLEEMGASL